MFLLLILPILRAGLFLPSSFYILGTGVQWGSKAFWSGGIVLDSPRQCFSFSFCWSLDAFVCAEARHCILVCKMREWARSALLCRETCTTTIAWRKIKT